MTTMESPATLSPAELRRLYEQMVLIRVFETESERQYKAARSAATATCPPARRRRRWASSTRCRRTTAGHGLSLPRLRARARGTPEAVMAELFGRARRLRSRPRRLDAPARRRARLLRRLGHRRRPAPVATGLALALVRRGKAQAVVCELGDGAINMGAWHESLNLAALWNLPVVFLVVNNGYGMGTSVQRASAEPDLYRRASPSGCTASASTATTSRPSSRPPTACSSAPARSASRPSWRSSPTATAATRWPTPGSPTAPRRRSPRTRPTTRSRGCAPRCASTA